MAARLLLSPLNRVALLSKLHVNFLLNKSEFHASEILNRAKTKEKNIPIFKYAGTNRRSKDRIYVWGYAGVGALGEQTFLLPKENKSRVYRVKKPWRLRWCDRTDAKVFQVACGNGFSLMAVASDTKSKGDKLYGTGMNTQSQIGCHKISNTDAFKYLIEPGLIHLPFSSPSSVKIKSISCGRAHSIVLTNEGVYTFGNNSYGQCGRNVIENEEYYGNPAVIQHLKPFIADPHNDELVDVKCGQDHTCFLTKKGQVYTCGWGADGQLGQNIFTISSKPTLVKGEIEGVKITKLASKCDFVLALNDAGELFGWGNNEYKQLHLSGVHEHQVGLPRYMKLPSYVKTPILDVACSGTHCLIIDKEYRVFVWGYGLLGKGPKRDESIEPIEIPPTIFGKYKDIPHTLNKRPRSVHCGLNCSAVIMDDGTLYMWGNNRYGILGTGDLNDVYFPLRVNIPAQVRTIDCGADHAFAICRSFI